jgi:hypothetical protein
MTCSGTRLALLSVDSHLGAHDGAIISIAAVIEHMTNPGAWARHSGSRSAECYQCKLFDINKLNRPSRDKYPVWHRACETDSASTTTDRPCGSVVNGGELPPPTQVSHAAVQRRSLSWRGF